MMHNLLITIIALVWASQSSVQQPVNKRDGDMYLVRNSFTDTSGNTNDVLLRHKKNR